jgi:MFS superfamily sulfate permease-like transporter
VASCSQHEHREPGWVIRALGVFVTAFLLFWWRWCSGVPGLMLVPFTPVAWFWPAKTVGPGFGTTLLAWLEAATPTASRAGAMARVAAAAMRRKVTFMVNLLV